MYYFNLKMSAPLNEQHERTGEMKMTARATTDKLIAEKWVTELLHVYTPFHHVARNDDDFAEIVLDSELLGDQPIDFYGVVGGFKVLPADSHGRIYEYIPRNYEDDEINQRSNTSASLTVTFPNVDDEPVEVDKFFVMDVGSDSKRPSHILGEYIYDSRNDCTLTPVVISSDLSCLSNREIPRLRVELQRSFETDYGEDALVGVTNIKQTPGMMFSGNFMFDGEVQSDFIKTQIIPIHYVEAN